MASDLDKAITRLAEADWTEDSKVTVVVEQPRERMPTLPDSDPPTSAGTASSIKGFGMTVRRVPAWVLALLGVVAIVAAAAAYVATHL